MSEEELCWCIRQLQLELDKKDLNPRKATEKEKYLRVLMNPKSPLPKKCMTMRAAFGDDYREKIKKDAAFKEERQMKIAPAPAPTNSKFFKRASTKASEPVPFKFGFSVPEGDQ